jgi:hypothetical protein
MEKEESSNLGHFFNFSEGVTGLGERQQSWDLGIYTQDMS